MEGRGTPDQSQAGPGDPPRDTSPRKHLRSRIDLFSHALHVALQGVRVQVNCLLWLEIEQAEHANDVYMHE